jgi:hypothetical protein
MMMVNQSAESEWRKKAVRKIVLMKNKGENLDIMVQKHPIIHPCKNNIWIRQIDSLRKSMICTEGDKSLFCPLMIIVLKRQRGEVLLLYGNTVISYDLERMESSLAKHSKKDDETTKSGNGIHGNNNKSDNDITREAGSVSTSVSTVATELHLPISIATENSIKYI